jgi:hypothetical protein
VKQEDCVRSGCRTHTVSAAAVLLHARLSAMHGVSGMAPAPDQVENRGRTESRMTIIGQAAAGRVRERCPET